MNAFEETHKDLVVCHKMSKHRKAKKLKANFWINFVTDRLEREAKLQLSLKNIKSLELKLGTGKSRQ